MSCASQTVQFTGTIVACGTRYSTPFETAFVTHFDARWVVTVDVEQADANAPAPAGERTSFLFHSPTHAFFERAEAVVGWRCRFTIERTETERGVQWSELSGTRMK